MKKLLLAAIAMAAVSTPAHADIFKYTQTNGDILTINTDTNTGSLVGNGINATFASDDFANFAGGAAPTGTFVLDSLGGTRTTSSGTFSPNASHTQKLIFSERNGGTLTNLWSYWGDSNQLGDHLTYVGGFTVTSSSSTSSGGSTGGTSTSSGGGGSSSSGGASSTGGTDVPAPGALLLFGLGAAGLFGGRRIMAKRKSDK